MNRQEYEEYLSIKLAGILTREEHQKAMAYLHSLSDEELEKASDEINQHFPEEMTLKEMMELQHEILQKRNMGNSGFVNIPVTFLPEDENAEWLLNISRSRPSNLILLDKKSDSEIIRLWTNGKTTEGIPADLFFSGCIPLPDCKVQVDEGGGNIAVFRVVIFPDYQKNLNAAEDGDSAQVVAVLYELNHSCIILSLEAIKGHDWVITEPIFGYKGIPADVRERIHQTVNVAELWTVMGECLSTWYGIQIALLHPAVKDVFLNPVTVIDHSADRKPSGGKKRKKRPLRYIKKHILNAEELKSRIHGENHFQRHALVWYVIGHWRRYADGKKIFIRPYWKGALRDLKNGEIREREIILEETT